ncbi:hypothetical protein HK102_004096 [Quaeritorhiza haematococci]|nr:hypothetical protein HK102_004096 [Quaeritorhiza haematococci]
MNKTKKTKPTTTAATTAAYAMPTPNTGDKMALGASKTSSRVGTTLNSEQTIGTIGATRSRTRIRSWRDVLVALEREASGKEERDAMDDILGLPLRELEHTEAVPKGEFYS